MQNSWKEIWFQEEANCSSSRQCTCFDDGKIHLIKARIPWISNVFLWISLDPTTIYFQTWKKSCLESVLHQMTKLLQPLTDILQIIRNQTLMILNYCKKIRINALKLQEAILKYKTNSSSKESFFHCYTESSCIHTNMHSEAISYYTA